MKLHWYLCEKSRRNEKVLEEARLDNGDIKQLVFYKNYHSHGLLGLLGFHKREYGIRIPISPDLELSWPPYNSPDENIVRQAYRTIKSRVDLNDLRTQSCVDIAKQVMPM